MTLWLASSALNALIAEGDDKAPLETGGLLVGYTGTPTAQVVVTGIVGPGPQAVHDETRFVPDADYQEFELAAQYERSGRQLTYLGDWHTHPTGTGDLSNADLRTLHEIARCRSARARQPIMLIACDQQDWQLAAWQFLGGPRRTARLCGIRIFSS